MTMLAITGRPPGQAPAAFAPPLFAPPWFARPWFARPWFARPWFARLSRRLRDRSRAAPDVIDAAVAVACFTAMTVPVLLGATSRQGPVAAIAGFGALAAIPLLARRRWPVATVIAIGAVYIAADFAAVGFTPFSSNAGPNFAIAVFTVADRCPRRRSLIVAASVAVATWLTIRLAAQVHPGYVQNAVQLAAAVPAWLIGDMVRSRREYRRRLAMEASRQAAEKEARIRAEERLGLSRDVHDVVSHSLSVIAVRSGVARLLLDDQPEEARVALTAIETASRAALDELRQLLRQIRDPAVTAESATPTLDDLPALITRMRGSGLRVSYRSTGRARAYSTATELSAYRIAQEALTNVVKHAAGASAVVEVRHGPDELIIWVADDGATAVVHSEPDAPRQGVHDDLGGHGGLGGRKASAGGLGIAGMRERAEMLDGVLIVGPQPGGGFAVELRLPVRGPAQ